MSKPEHGGHDLQPEAAARASAGGTAGAGLDAERPQQLERVAEAVGDALQHRAPERAAIVAQRQARERAPRVRGSTTSTRRADRSRYSQSSSVPACRPTSPSTTAQYTFSTVPSRNCSASRAAALLVRANSSTPDTGRSSRWTTPRKTFPGLPYRSFRYDFTARSSVSSRPW